MFNFDGILMTGGVLKNPVNFGVLQNPQKFMKLKKPGPNSEKRNAICNFLVNY